MIDRNGEKDAKTAVKEKNHRSEKMQQLALLELAERSKHLISDWGCVCESCADWRAMPDPEGMLATVLTGLTGRAVQPFKMTQEEPTVEACLREFATEIDLVEFIDGRARTSRPLLPYRGCKPEDRPMLCELSVELAEHVKAARVQ